MYFKNRYINWRYKIEKNPLKVLLEIFPEKCWNWYYISQNPNITMSDILKHPNLPWNWNDISYKTNITIRNWYYVSQNPNITLKDILTHPEKPWSWAGLSLNKFLYDDTMFSKEIKNSINNNRKKIEKLKLYGDLNRLVNKYVGYL
jgi:hypothetical protein